MFQLRSCCSWLKVRFPIALSIRAFIHIHVGFGTITDEAEVAFMTGILGEWYR